MESGILDKADIQNVQLLPVSSWVKVRWVMSLWMNKLLTYSIRCFVFMAVHMSWFLIVQYFLI